MFAPFRNEGVWDSWVQRWREWRGVDRWPTVNARVNYKEWMDDGESGYYRMDISYSFGGREFSKQIGASVGLANDTPVDGNIEVRVNPKKPESVLLADTQQAAWNLSLAVILVAFAVIVLAFKYL